MVVLKHKSIVAFKACEALHFIPLLKNIKVVKVGIQILIMQLREGANHSGFIFLYVVYFYK